MNVNLVMILHCVYKWSAKGYAITCIPVVDSATITQMATSVNTFTECTHLTLHHNQQSLNMKTTHLLHDIFEDELDNDPLAFVESVRDHSKGTLIRVF